jgi:ATP-dependent DNA helicase RecG
MAAKRPPKPAEPDLLDDRPAAAPQAPPPPLPASAPKGRPAVLFPLFADLDTLDGVGPKTVKLMEALAITRPRDLIFTLPQGVVDRRPRASIRDYTPPVTATVTVTVGAHQPSTRRGGPYRVTVTDAATDFALVFFHPRPDWLQRMLPYGQRRVVSGKLELLDRKSVG